MWTPTDKEYSERMKDVNKRADIEVEHVQADDLLCELLVKLGYHKTVEEFKKIEKWYA